MKEIEVHDRTGRSLGNNRFLKMAEKVMGKNLIKKKPELKSKEINYNHIRHKELRLSSCIHL